MTNDNAGSAATEDEGTKQEWRRRGVLFAATLICAYGAYLMLQQKGLWFVCGGMLLGGGLYIIRDAGRLLYAILEILFAAFLLWKAASAGKGDFSGEFGPEFSRNDLSVIVLQSMAAVYVLIRGFDNLTKATGWPEEGWYLRPWSSKR